MGIKDLFKREDNLSKELKMLPRETKKRILANVIRRKNEILEERLLEKQLKEHNKPEPKPSKWSGVKEGMANRREELRRQGVLKPIIRYDKKNLQSPLEEMSRKSRANMIKGLEDQRNRLKSGCTLDCDKRPKIKDLRLKVPKSDGLLKKGKKKHGFI